MKADDLQEKMVYIAKAIAKGRYRYTIHGAQQRIARRIRRYEVEEAVVNGEVIEDYQQHHYGPACLVLGKTAKGKAIHILCSLQQLVDIITVYEPDLTEWEQDLKTRRRIYE